MGLLDFSGGYKTVTSLVGTPWAGLGIGAILAALVVAGTVIFSFETPFLAVAVGFVFLLPCISQLAIAADFVTDTAIIRRRGVFVPRYVITPLATIIRVEFQYPRFGQFFGVGDLFVQASDTTLEFLSIKSPEKVAHLIQRLCDRTGTAATTPSAV